jgi:hypothetical protein
VNASPTVELARSATVGCKCIERTHPEQPEAEDQHHLLLRLCQQVAVSPVMHRDTASIVMYILDGRKSKSQKYDSAHGQNRHRRLRQVKHIWEKSASTSLCKLRYVQKNETKSDRTCAMKRAAATVRPRTSVFFLSGGLQTRLKRQSGWGGLERVPWRERRTSIVQVSSG